jgi:predicted site-specific integrase-resolvase
MRDETIQSPVDDFARLHEACQLLRCTPAYMARLVKLGKVRTLELPGAKKRYHRGDVERVIRDAIGTREPSLQTA